MQNVEGATGSEKWEESRVAALRSYAVLDTPAEGSVEDVTQIASLICDTPIADVNFIDAERQWFKCETGLGVRETPLGPSICAHAILQDDIFVVPDTTMDTRFAANPLVTGDPRLRFYAGGPLLTSDGHAIGTVCVLDVKPREPPERQLHVLKALARQTMTQLELRKALAHEKRAANFRIQLMAAVGHDLKSPLRTIGYAIEKVRREASEDHQARLAAAGEALTQVDADFSRLIALAVSDNGAGRPEKFFLDVSDVLDPLADVWKKTATRKGLLLEYVPSRARVFSHPALLATIAGNLLSNAIKHTEAPGRVLPASVPRALWTFSRRSRRATCPMRAWA